MGANRVDLARNPQPAMGRHAYGLCLFCIERVLLRPSLVREYLGSHTRLCTYQPPHIMLYHHTLYHIEIGTAEILHARTLQGVLGGMGLHASACNIYIYIQREVLMPGKSSSDLHLHLTRPLHSRYSYLLSLLCTNHVRS
jgi:hypothetical protein